MEQLRGFSFHHITEAYVASSLSCGAERGVLIHAWTGEGKGGVGGDERRYDAEVDLEFQKGNLTRAAVGLSEPPPTHR